MNDILYQTSLEKNLPEDFVEKMSELPGGIEIV